MLTIWAKDRQANAKAIGKCTVRHCFTASTVRLSQKVSEPGSPSGPASFQCRFLQTFTGPFDQEFPGQSAGDVGQHGADSQPAEDGVEMDAGMHQDHQ